MAAVSAGAELLADGNIHVYGPLRGRALAGINGNLEARIFVSKWALKCCLLRGNTKLPKTYDATLYGEKPHKPI